MLSIENYFKSKDRFKQPDIVTEDKFFTESFDFR